MKKIFLFVLTIVLFYGCKQNNNRNKPAAQILGNPEYTAFSYGGYREDTREIVPTVEQLKEDMKILSAMGVKIIRTYNTKLKQAPNLLQAITELKKEDPDFEMYVMLGAWIECKGAWGDERIHNEGDVEDNTAEIERAVEYTKQYPDIVKIIAVGNEAMVRWAENYYVMPDIILKWVNYLQQKKKSGELPAELWITSSDNYESWGGGATEYHLASLDSLIKAVDFVSLHTYPFHETHYVPDFWGVRQDEAGLSDIQKAEVVMKRALERAKQQYNTTAAYVKSVDKDKPLHIGETGWASVANDFYGPNGSMAADEFKAKMYYDMMRQWTDAAGISCFYFEAFDEKWKDENDPLGSENHFGLINLKNEAKYALWDIVDAGIFDGLTRDGKPITKTYNGDKEAMMKDFLVPKMKDEMGVLKITDTNQNRTAGEVVNENMYIVVHDSINPQDNNSVTLPSAFINLISWEGTCSLEMSPQKVIEISSGIGEWWGCSLQFASESGKGENMAEFKNGYLNFDIKGETDATFQLGFQTGVFADGNQTNNFVLFGGDNKYSVSDEWQTYKIPVSELNNSADLNNVTGIMYLRGIENNDGKNIHIKNIYYSK